MPWLSFREAVERVRKEEGAAFAFCPIACEGTLGRSPPAVGANLFVVARRAVRARPPKQTFEYCVHYVGGLYGTASLARERYRPGRTPPQAREASYRFFRRFDEPLLYGELRTIRRRLERRAEPL